MRTVDIDVRTKTWDDVVRATEGKCIEALAYLTTFALTSDQDRDSYCHITVTGHDNELAALYKPHKDDKGGMLMVAVWWNAEQRYTFHT